MIKKKTVAKAVTISILSLCIYISAFASLIAQQRLPDSISLDVLQHGDLLFVGASQADLSGAIDRVTQTEAATRFDHIALIERTSGDSVFMLHANPRTGSARELITSYLKSQEAKGKDLVIYRLKPAYHASIPQAIETAKTLLGQPYNFSYILSDSTLYCSDFVERAFRKEAIFTLNPMTFIDPATGQTDTFWESYYEKMGLPVPEGLPGCNPNGMAASDKLELIGILARDI